MHRCVMSDSKMSVTLSEPKNDLIKRVAEYQGFKNYDIEVKSGSMKGDGYMGVINTIQIQEKNNNPKKLNLIIKSAMSGEKLREHTPVRKAYEREIFMYETIFPEFDKFSQENGISDKFTETAKCYGSLFEDKEECLILENLKEIDFKLWNRKLPMNAEHVELVFATYAKFHGTSLALKILEPEKYEALSKNLKNIFQKDEENEEEAKRFEASAKQVFSNGFKALVGKTKALEAFSNFTQNFIHFFKHQIRNINKYSCIIHGDCWCNNMMFKYSDTTTPTRPTEMCLLDWQVSHIGSPIQDLSYFFYASASKEVLYDLKKFLKVYHNAFTQILKDAGIDPNEVLTFEELEEQWKIYSKFGLFMTLFVMKVVLGEVEDAPDLSELADSGKDILESISSSKCGNIEQVNQRISDVIVFMTENDYL